MKYFLVKRFLLIIPVLIGVITVVFLFIHMIPGDPVELMLGEGAQAVDKDLLRSQLGIDKPLAEQYFHFVFGLFRGDLGYSISFRQPVMPAIIERLPATIELATAAMIIAMCIGIPIGIFAALRQYSLLDNLAMLVALIGVSMPIFWLGPLLILLFSIKLNLLPVSGREGFTSIILPAVTLGLVLSALLSRMTRASMLEVLKEEYLVAARAKGLKEAKVIGKHALRNALVPILTVVGMQFGSLLSGAIITETIFSWPGLGRLLIKAIEARDYSLVQGCVLVIAIIYVSINFLIDLSYALVNPRIRFQ